MTKFTRKSLERSFFPRDLHQAETFHNKLFIIKFWSFWAKGDLLRITHKVWKERPKIQRKVGLKNGILFSLLWLLAGIEQCSVICAIIAYQRVIRQSSPSKAGLVLGRLAPKVTHGTPPPVVLRLVLLLLPPRMSSLPGKSLPEFFCLRKSRAHSLNLTRILPHSHLNFHSLFFTLTLRLVQMSSQTQRYVLLDLLPFALLTQMQTEHVCQCIIVCSRWIHSCPLCSLKGTG